MAAPDAPANLAAKPGPHPGSMYVNADAVTADPEVDTYTVYVDHQTGVATDQYIAKYDLLVDPDVMLEGLPEGIRLYVTITATNSEDEGSAATEVEVVLPGS